jgi:hypothetical protein
MKKMTFLQLAANDALESTIKQMLLHLIVPGKKKEVETCQDRNKTKLQNWNQL